jgi:hypothetical protein
VLVAIENGDSIHVLDRRDGAREALLFPGARRALLRLHGVGVHIVPRKSVFRRDEVGRDALRHEVGRNGDGRIDRPGAARGADADAAHALDAAADRKIVLAGHDLGRREIHRVEPRGAEAVDLHAGNLVAKARGERAGARNVSPGFANGIDTAQDHVVDLRAREAVARLDRLERGHRKPERRDFMQGAVDLAASARRAHGVIDVSVRHHASLRME